MYEYTVVSCPAMKNVTKSSIKASRSRSSSDQLCKILDKISVGTCSRFLSAFNLFNICSLPVSLIYVRNDLTSFTSFMLLSLS